jgi:hypothetical protein
MVSLRGVNRHAAWCSNYEFEDVACDVDDVDLYSLEPGSAYETRQWLARRLIWRQGLRVLTPLLNPGLRELRIDRDYDLFVFVCMNPADLIYLNAVRGWKTRCAKKICFMVEFYAGWLKEYAYHLSLLHEFDDVALCFSGSVSAVTSAASRPCQHVPLGADVFRFSPFPDPPERSIDVYSMGRRVEPIHDVLRTMAARKEIFYIYDTLPGTLIQPRDHRQHRDLLASCAQRARFFVTYPAKVDADDERRGQSEVGARFYEGAAAGAVLIGQAPTIPAFAQDFSWPDAVVDVGSAENTLRETLSALEANPARTQALRRTNALEAIRRFDWGYRWRQLLEIAGLPPTPALLARERKLQQLAEFVESAPPAASPRYAEADARRWEKSALKN